MASFVLLSGTKYDIVAENEDEALAKFVAHFGDDDCPCGRARRGREAYASHAEICDCVKIIEVDTWIEPN